VELNKDITMDVQHPALSGSTAQPSMNKMLNLIRNYPDERVAKKSPQLNNDAIKASMSSLYRLRFQYRDLESRYNSELVEAMYDARTPGGASATLKSIPGLVENLGRLLGVNGNHADWDQIQIAIYKMQAEILEDLGQPTQVTPYAANTTGQAALSLWNQLEGRDKYHSLYPGIADYLVGRHGKVPSSTSKKLIKKALKQLNLKTSEKYTKAVDRPNGIPNAEEKLVEVGLLKPTLRQNISASLLKDSGSFKAIEHILSVANECNSPDTPPQLPFYAMPPNPKIRADGSGFNRDIRDAVSAIGGYSKLQEIAERVLHIKQLVDRRYIFPAGEEDLEKKWLKANIERLRLIIQNIPLKLSKANFTDGQKMIMLNENNPNNIHLTIRDAVDQKGPGLYDFMIKILEVES
jgi:hypothetical protein